MATVVITGGSSGIGLATARLFSSKGYTVYEFSRHGLTQDGIVHVDCDITDNDAVIKALEYVVAQSGSVDILINNAGMGISGAVEFTSIEDVKRQFDVNFFGMVRVCTAVLPIMRKQGAGRIINLSSVAAALAIPFQTYYSATKSAINSFTLALANEVKPFNIKVSAVMPGDVSTGFTGSRKKNTEGTQVYKALARSVATMENDEINGLKPTQIAKIIYKVANKRNPKPLTTGGAKYKIFVTLSKILPTRFVNYVVGKLYAK